MVNLKKQSQSAEGENEHKISHNKGLRRNSMFLQPMKTKPNKPNLEWNEGLFTYGARDCHGPSGLAMTSVSLLLCGFVPPWLIVNLKKQSQFAEGQNDTMSVLTMVYRDFNRWGRRENKANQSQFAKYLDRPHDRGTKERCKIMDFAL